MSIHLKVARDFSPVPIGRYRSDSLKSGEAFREDILKKKVKKALKDKDTLIVDFDGMEFMNTSFLEEAFGGLVRNNLATSEELLSIIKFLPENTYLDFYIEKVKKYISEAKKEHVE